MLSEVERSRWSVPDLTSRFSRWKDSQVICDQRRGVCDDLLRSWTSKKAELSNPKWWWAKQMMSRRSIRDLSSWFCWWKATQVICSQWRCKRSDVVGSTRFSVSEAFVMSSCKTASWSSRKWSVTTKEEERRKERVQVGDGTFCRQDTRKHQHSRVQCHCAIFSFELLTKEIGSLLSQRTFWAKCVNEVVESLFLHLYDQAWLVTTFSMILAGAHLQAPHRDCYFRIWGWLEICWRWGSSSTWQKTRKPKNEFTAGRA